MTELPVRTHLMQGALTVEVAAAAAFESAPLPLCVVEGSPLRLVAANRLLRAILGPSAVSGQLLDDLLEHEVAARVAHAVQDAAATGHRVDLAEQRLGSDAARGPAGADVAHCYDLLIAPLEPVSSGRMLIAAIDLTSEDDLRRVHRHDAQRAMMRRIAERARDQSQFDHALAAGVEERGRLGSQRNSLRRKLGAAEENERRRLARELHDQLGQHLTALTLGLDEIAGMLPADSPAVVRLASLLRLTTLLTRDVRYLAVELRPPELDDVGLESAMATYIEQWTSRFHVAIDFEVTGSGSVPSGEVSSAIYRIMQEALTNIAKHAGARQVSVILELTPDAVRLICEDDGHGFDAADRRTRAYAEGRLGLAGMHERALMLGGTMQIESAPGDGTTVFVALPIDAGGH